MTNVTLRASFVLHWAPCMEPASLSASVCVCVCVRHKPPQTRSPGGAPHPLRRPQSPGAHVVRTAQGCVVSRAPPSGIRGSVSCSHGAGQTDRPSGAPAAPTPHPKPNLGNHLLGPLRLRDQPPPAWRWAPRGDPPPPDRPAGPPGGGRPAPPPAPIAGGPAPDAAPAAGSLGPSCPAPSVCPRGPAPHAGSPLRGFLHKLGLQGTPWLTGRAARAGRGAGSGGEASLPNTHPPAPSGASGAHRL
ncbi:unnamed protein product [Nyctereutes procyonoides]|uniref:(raccoon dog) hypothetical protein n=1 Tax=Nyctereutes procyonoides TaxID=34880 RepID=A0A811Z056_NYCPR|nr:unnamed protein product [Nyctereutes procyonoides]